MISAIAAPTDVELPKAPLKSSSATPRGLDAVAVPANADASGAAPAGASAEFQYYERDDVKMRLTTKDGDVFEVRASFTFAATYDMASAGTKGDGNDAAEGANGLPTLQDGLAKGMALARKMEHELHQQQVKLMEKMLKDGQGMKDAGNGRFVMVTGALFASNGTDAAAGPDAQDAAVPDYWNADNTSNRIVDFATAFAGMKTPDGKDFGETIRKAIADGFDQAHAITGDLPGAAGKLYNDTRKQVFAKLDKWLADNPSEPYNQTAQPSESAPA